MKIVKGIFIILVHLAVGVALSRLISGFLPGSVIGMILMFLSLRLGLVKPESVRETALFLTGNMIVFFLPPVIGIMDLWGLIKVNLVGWILVLVISTVLVMALSGKMQELVEYVSTKYVSKKKEVRK